jgi:hypothetical protein
VSSWRQQGVIDAPVPEVWELAGNPNRYPEWASEIASVTGLPRVEKDATYRQVSKLPGGDVETTFQIDELDELHSIRMRCLDTRTYLRLALTEARGQTFVDIEAGADEGVEVSEGSKVFFRRLTDQMLDGLREALA